MATKHISDVQVIEAILQAQTDWRWDACEVLMFRTKECEKVCMAALERAYGRGLIECGVRLARGWVTDKGRELLKKESMSEQNSNDNASQTAPESALAGDTNSKAATPPNGGDRAAPLNAALPGAPETK